MNKVWVEVTERGISWPEIRENVEFCFQVQVRKPVQRMTIINFNHVTSDN